MQPLIHQQSDNSYYSQYQFAKGEYVTIFLIVKKTWKTFEADNQRAFLISIVNEFNIIIAL